MPRRTTLVAVGLFLAAIGSVVAAEPKRDEPQAQPNVFGMGPPGSFGPLSNSWGVLLRSPPVWRELELDPEQLDKLRDIGLKAAAQMREAFGSIQDLRDASPDERKQKMEDFAKKAQIQSEEVRSQIEAVLSRRQLERLRQITIQFRGLSALEDSEVQTSLKLSQAQNSQLMAIRTATSQRLRDLWRAGWTEAPSSRRQKAQAVLKEAHDKTVDVLTKEQASQFEAMKGRKFDFDPFPWMPRGADSSNAKGK